MYNLLLLVFPVFLAIISVLVYLIYLLIRALRKYIKSEPVRKEKSEITKSLEDVIKRHRMECKMTQEFVAEALGVSRQAVSKWESGASDPSTSNLSALAKLFGTTAEELLKELKVDT
ncbi:MAG: helix-turn-helix domain-containing protein [Eubacteriales bacterium]